MNSEFNAYQTPVAELLDAGDDTQHGSKGPYTFKFHGRAGEYFGVWIVNLLLTIFTLGLYSAWAKVRSTRYIMSHLELDGSRFEYHGKPWPIFWGRLLMFVIMLVYGVINKVYPMYGALFLIPLFLLSPWIIIKTIRFRTRNISYRNLHFGFKASIFSGYKYFCFLPLAAIVVFAAPIFGLVMLKATHVDMLPTWLAVILGLCLGLGYYLAIPVIQYAQVKFLVDNVHFGTTDMSMRPAIKPWFKTFILATLLFIGVLIAETAVAAAVVGIALGLGYVSKAAPPTTSIIVAAVIFYVVLLSTYFTGFQIFKNQLAKLRWNHTNLGGFGFANTVTIGEMIPLYVVNFLATVFTLGLAYPWAKIRSLKYTYERLTLDGPATTADFVAADSVRAGPTGEALAQGFDFDISL